jgi:hypothetical protein
LTALRFVDHVAADFDLPGFVVERVLHQLAGGDGQFVARASGLGLNLSEWSSFGGPVKQETVGIIRISHNVLWMFKGMIPKDCLTKLLI